MDVIETISSLKLVPVVKLDRVEDAVPLAQALLRAGLPVAEITFRTEAAEESIRQIAAQVPQVLVGAGTITSVEQAKRALDAGAKFFVTPGFNRDVAQFCKTNQVPLFPGVCTPTEVMMLMEFGFTVAKFFPAGQYGGLKTIQALAGPFPQLKFMPTGGVNESNVLEYLSSDKIIACGGSWMVKDSLIRAGDFAAIEELTRSAVQLVQSA